MKSLEMAVIVSQIDVLSRVATEAVEPSGGSGAGRALRRPWERQGRVAGQFAGQWPSERSRCLYGEIRKAWHAPARKGEVPGADRQPPFWPNASRRLSNGRDSLVAFGSRSVSCLL